MSMITFIIITNIPHMPTGSSGYFKSQTDIPPISSAPPVIIIQ